MASKPTKIKASGRIIPQKGIQTRPPFGHQNDAMKSLDRMNQSPSYSTIVVLPTGGGKTYTAVLWLLRTALNYHKKVLWLAHRHILLEQAAESFQRYACRDDTPNIDSFCFRIVSGAPTHDSINDISPKDDLLIVSKDSVARNPACLDTWLDGLPELYLIVDEAHHSAARSYRKIIDYIKSRVSNVKMIGLTATPFQKEIDDPGLLREVYPDDITYEISLKELINRQILSKPTFEMRPTGEHYGGALGMAALKSIQRSDQIPDDIAEQMALSAARNKLIVDTYLANQEKFGQTIVFAVNVVHAIQLSGVFKSAGVKADYVVSSVRDSLTGAVTKKTDNDKKIAAYRSGKLQVLISVNILSEGVDLPQTKSVFLTRPTVSPVLMTQMVGRALRGAAAGGTKDAYIVSFIDDWTDKIAWVNPGSLFLGTGGEDDDPAEKEKRDIRTIAISKIEEFAKILDDSVDTAALERLPFYERIPYGMYCIRLEGQGEDDADIFYQVMVYNNAKELYEAMMNELPSLFRSFEVDVEYLSDDLLSQMENHCRATYFCGEMIPPYRGIDIINVLKYYAQYGRPPQFYTFDAIDRGRLDVHEIAQHIWDQRMMGKARQKYENSLWNDGDDNILRLLFGRKLYYLKQIDIEYVKIAHPEAYVMQKTVCYGDRELEELTLAQIRDIDPDAEQRLYRAAFRNFRNGDGQYRCAQCGMTHPDRICFHAAHIKPLEQGGRSIPENMQILCRSCYEKQKQ